ncbi:MAG: hypothetical protein FWB75_02410 [Oscillospiraceae bacterium]|nr:hypothetical protein [Oscillospiraceae bacterium]
MTDKRPNNYNWRGWQNLHDEYVSKIEAAGARVTYAKQKYGYLRTTRNQFSVKTVFGVFITLKAVFSIASMPKITIKIILSVFAKAFVLYSISALN